MSAKIKAQALAISLYSLFYAWFVFPLNPWYSINEFAESSFFSDEPEKINGRQKQ